VTLRAEIATSKPAAARCAAHALPIPRLAPVTSATGRFAVDIDSSSPAGASVDESALTGDGTMRVGTEQALGVELRGWCQSVACCVSPAFGQPVTSWISPVALVAAGCHVVAAPATRRRHPPQPEPLWIAW
jgi:hypothetical protein